ncbi:heavy metal translocating P-type ATPase [Pseudomonas aeruginosa]|uniref:heavy metal translocating P-type ATPase n=1 Tax=Pseudomonas aeruginosa TaxID=287 RepID=UPI001F4AD4F7|nr:heavy metal translocating P-type ATPase [Pseudomonas aeruginosa]
MSAPLPCYHCGLPVPAGSRFEARVLGETRAMCCPGCQAVAEAIVAGGLESYYRHRSENAANPEALPKALSEELQLYDRPDVQRGFVRHEGELAETSLMIEGISCAACGWLIEKHLRQLPGVAEARLNLSNHRLHVRWQDSQLPLSQLLGELRQIGYAGHPYQPDRATERLAMENRHALRQLGVAGLLWIQVMMAVMATWPEFNLDLSAGMDRILRWVSLILTTPIVFYCCGQFFRGALRDLRTRHLTMDVSVSLAIGGAYVAGIWSTITGQGERILLSELRVGDRVLVPPGAVLPADGVILDGQSSVDESLLTGEYLPHPRQAGDAVTGGTLNVEGPLTVEVGALGDDSRLSAIVRLLERAQADKPRLAELADKVAQWFLLIVLLVAAAVGALWWQVDHQRAFWVVLSLLVATCPCALSLATPTALTAATGSLHKLGLLITRGHVLEGLNHIDTVIFDKTGTLTEGRLTLKQVLPLRDLDADRCLALAAALENRSEHPIARAFGRAPEAADSVASHPGLGLEGLVEGRRLRIGQAAFVSNLGGSATPAMPGDSGQWLLLGDEQGPLAWFGLDDRLRSDAPALLAACKARGWRTLLLSGDASPMVASVAAELGIDEARGGLTPDDKLAMLERLHGEGRRVLMLGDGVNDVPVLAGADISVAMGSATDLAKTSADAVLLSNRLDSLVQAFRLARRTRHIIIENLAWASLYNGLVLPFAALGWITPGWAAIGMSVSSLLVVVNALRLTRIPSPRSVWPRSTS